MNIVIKNPIVLQDIARARRFRGKSPSTKIEETSPKEPFKEHFRYLKNGISLTKCGGGSRVTYK